MEALNNNVIIKAIDSSAGKKSKFIIPDTAKQKPTKGEVVAVSDSIKEKGKLSKGDIVYYPLYLGVDIELEGKLYTVLSYEDILVKVPKKK